MEIHQEPLSEIDRYLANKSHLTLNDMRPDYDSYMELLRRFATITPETRILEIGTGTGWFPLMAKLEGLHVRGLEISPQLVENARKLGREAGVEADIQLGNAEEADIGDSEYDVIVAHSVFEHIQKWQVALDRVYRALKPGGIFSFNSTCRFSPVSYEYPALFYGWMPDQMRYHFRMRKQGADVMKLGIDFNQFTYPQLRGAFRKAGFREIYDRIDLARPSRFSGAKAQALKLMKGSALLKWPVLTFCDATVFICRK